MKTWAFRFVCFAMLALGLALNATAQTTSGVIKAGKVEGEVFRITADGQSTQLKAGDRLIETDTVTTGNESLVVLVFMNGSSVKIGADSKLSIEQFKMDPLGEELNVAGLQSEPSVSQTSLNLTYGEMVGEVKKLNTASNYTIKTPVGAAGIRGTTYRIVFRPTGDGRAFNFQLSTGEGLVVFTGTTDSSGAQINVAQDQEVVVTATVDATTGVVTVNTPTSSQPISVEAQQLIVAAVTQVIQQAKQATVITTTEQQQSATQTPPTPTTPTPTTPTPTTPTPTPTPTTPTPTPTPPPPVTPRPPDLTPGAGK